MGEESKGQRSGRPTVAGAQQGLRGGGLGVRVSWRAVGLGPGWCPVQLRDREPGRMEQQLCRPTGWSFGRLAVLLLDHGMEKPFMI
jgi:hypothetical protein